MKSGKWAAKKIAVLAVFTALSLITFLLESLLPSMIVPGAKPGLANIFSFAALIMYTPAEAFIVIALRTFLGAIFSGNLSALLYSFTGGVAAMGVSSLLIYCSRSKISVLAVSVAAACTHNAVQGAVFAIISRSAASLYYIPYLVLIGVLSGAVVGAAIMLIFKKVPLSVYAKVIAK